MTQRHGDYHMDLEDISTPGLYPKDYRSYHEDLYQYVRRSEYGYEDFHLAWHNLCHVMPPPPIQWLLLYIWDCDGTLPTTDDEVCERLVDFGSSLSAARESWIQYQSYFRAEKKWKIRQVRRDRGQCYLPNQD